VSAWIAIPIGVALGTAAVLLIIYATAGLPRIGKPRVLPVLVFPFAIVVGLLGIGLLVSLAARLFRNGRARRLARSHPGAPWLADHAWDPRGARDDTLRRALQNLAGAFFVGLFLVPFNWLAFFSRGELPLAGRIIFGLVTGFFDLLVIGLFVYGVYLLARLATHGASVLRFERFPYLLGTPLAAALRVGGRGPAHRRLSATLRCIEEKWERRDSESASTVCYQIYADRRQIEPPFAPLPDGREARISFDLPDLPIGTRLADQPPRYWELEVRSEGPGVDYAATFLVPVYDSSGSRFPTAGAREPAR
jgi:hypothetical protein